MEPDDLAAYAAQEARDGDGWIKLVGDWISRDEGDLAPSFPAEAFAAAIEAAHAEGAKVTAHCFGHGVLPGPDRRPASTASSTAPGSTEDLIDAMVAARHRAWCRPSCSWTSSPSTPRRAGADKVLTETLRFLERDGLVSRVVVQELPPYARYQLTELGRSLRMPLQALTLWALEHPSAEDCADDSGGDGR